MIRHGVHPVTLDKRDYSYHRSFGTKRKALFFPDSLMLDLGLTVQDQVADGFPNGCTGYAQANAAGNADGVVYSGPYTYAKTCFMEWHDTTKPCFIRNSFQSTEIYGLLREGQTDQEAESNRRGPYFNVYDDSNMDWFDSLRSAMLQQKICISVITPWFGEWESTNAGIVTKFFMYDGVPEHYPWHNWNVVGYKMINNEPYLIGKSWQGKSYGDGGFHYLDRETTNKVMAIYGSAAFIQPKAKPGDVVAIKITIMQFVLVLLHRILGILQPLN